MNKSLSKGDLVIALIAGEAWLGRVKRVDGDTVSIGNPGVALEDLLVPPVARGEMHVVDRSLVTKLPASRS